MIFKEDIWYERANDYRKLHIYLPNDYFYSDEAYPVMYFFDGHNLFSDEDATFGKSWGLKEYLENWNKPIIIVGLECSHNGDERLSEYLPYFVEKGFLSDQKGYGQETLQWIVDVVKPHIDQKYRTISDRLCTGIAGSSMGGLMALYGVINYNNWFSKAACVSSAILSCTNSILEDVKEHYIDSNTRIYMSWGTNEVRGLKNRGEVDNSSTTYKCNKRVKDALMKKEASVQLYCQIEGQHCEADWENQVPLFMEYLWQERNVENVE